ncbi:nose resistant to fluoxetine protein 6-like isoform X1 [Hermetia illucens]|nr:nose resistant to fluoxetine protein 6-like isoform X1 [Hermetia illucens]
MVRIGIRCLVVALILSAYVRSEWNFGEIDNLVIAYNDKDLNDSITYQKVKESLYDNPRKFNDTLCVLQFRRIFEGVSKKEKWAEKVMDSWGRVPPSGLYWGRTIDLGHFDECISTAHDFGEENEIFVGQYCIASYPLHVLLHDNLDNQETIKLRNAHPTVFSRGVCVPDACSLDMLDSIFKQFIYNRTKIQVNETMFNAKECTINEVERFNGYDIFALIVFSLVGLLVVLSTFYDIMTGYLNRKRNDLYIIFSIPSNAKKLFNIDPKKGSSSRIECLNGIRFISIVWVVYGHIFATLPNVPIANYKYLWEWLTEIYTMVIVSGSFAVDTFFVLSGFLLAYHLLREMDKRGRLTFAHIMWMYFHRYLRLFPILAATILFTTTLHRFIGDGPLWKKVGGKVGINCPEYWWTSLLYIQNIVNPSKLCLVHTWYLSADTQLYFLAPLILIPLHKWGRKFIPFIILTIVCSVSYLFMSILGNNLSLNALDTLANRSDPLSWVNYCNIHTRASPWLLGILLGYYQRNLKRATFKLSRLSVSVGWICCILLMIVLIFGPYQMQQYLGEQNRVANALYGSLAKFAWGLAIVWIVFACVQGYGGLVNEFLSYPLWQLLGRLTYAIYLIHPPVQVTTAALARMSVFYTNFVAIQNIWRDLGIILTISIVLALVFESPMIALEKLLVRKNHRSEVKTNGNTPQIVSLHLSESMDCQKTESKS